MSHTWNCILIFNQGKHEIYSNLIQAWKAFEDQERKSNLKYLFIWRYAKIIRKNLRGDIFRVRALCQILGKPRENRDPILRIIHKLWYYIIILFLMQNLHVRLSQVCYLPPWNMHVTLKFVGNNFFIDRKVRRLVKCQAVSETALADRISA